ncbi:unnamed protein product [Vitrella brassicaformis CCMP3155]|uniref:Holocytochrome c-type synthase n=2 Tax=Vitrella brassicaformis TaxID=1169539 RepID=A0A0G4EVP5_VITBC|nr:unnamed protein product [Vitrella brassicaformis CCMP3155]|eukprot:CEM02166.1 unnamed protein product [Vitrella brassicaformis CCMP3155]
MVSDDSNQLRGCPIDHSKMPPASSSPPSGCPIDHSKMQASQASPAPPAQQPSGCPIDHTKLAQAKAAGCPIDHTQMSQSSPSPSPSVSPESAPLRGWEGLMARLEHQAQQIQRQGAREKQQQGFEQIDPRNMMPVIPNKPTSADSDVLLSTSREHSTIPKTGSDEVWVYPSPQQFYNALLRKDKDPEADHMDATVYVHNWVNEQTWKGIMKWEEMHNKECPNPTLTRFVGKSDDLSLRARYNSLFTHLGRPFDRHDWFVDRCGEQVRYIIDYYDDQTLDDDIQVTIDTRPAPDSLSNIWDRIKRPFWLIWKQRQAAADTGSSPAPA